MAHTLQNLCALMMNHFLNFFNLQKLGELKFFFLIKTFLQWMLRGLNGVLSLIAINLVTEGTMFVEERVCPEITGVLKNVRVIKKRKYHATLIHVKVRLFRFIYHSLLV